MTKSMLQKKALVAVNSSWPFLISLHFTEEEPDLSGLRNSCSFSPSLSLSPLFFWRRVTFPISSTDLGLPRPLHNRSQSVPSLDNGVVVGLSLRKRITLRVVSFPGSSFSNCPFPRHEIQSILASPSLGLGTVAFQSSELQILRFTTQINIISRWGRQNVEFRNHVGSFAFGALQQLPIYLGLFFT